MSLTPLSLLNRLTSKARLRDIQAIVTLVDLGSMGRAAQAMGMTQPAMSQLVAELEQLIETKLFFRHSKGVEPTAATIELLPAAHRMISAAEEAAEHIASRHRQDIGVVRIGATAAGLCGLINPALRHFLTLYPEVQVHLNTVLGQSLDSSFRSNDHDLVCCRMRVVVPEGWTFQSCIGDDLVVVGCQNHPFATRESVTSEELGQATWLQNHIATTARHHFEELSVREGWTSVDMLKVIAREPVTIWTLLRHGTALCLVPRSVVRPWIEEGLLRVIPTSFKMPLSPIGFYWKNERAGPATRLFAEELTSAAQDSPKISAAQ